MSVNLSNAAGIALHHCRDRIERRKWITILGAAVLSISGLSCCAVAQEATVGTSSQLALTPDWRASERAQGGD